MPTRWQIDSLRSRLKSLEQEISRIAEKDHPYRDPDTVYEALKAVIASRLSMLNAVQAEYPLGDIDSERKLQGALFAIAESAEAIAELFNHVERVDSARIPFEILRSLSWVASSLFKEECHVIVRLHADYNYTIGSCRREFEDQDWQDAWEIAVESTRAKRTAHLSVVANPPESNEGRLPYTVLVLGFPSYEANSILLHALAAHELAHEMFYRDEDKIFKV